MTFKYRYRKQIIVTCIILTLMVVFSYYFYISKQELKRKEKKSSILLDTKKEKEEKTKKSKQEPQEIMVDVKGEVVNQGIYTLKKGSRVIDAINMAGGLTNVADTSVLNLSKKLTDEMVIIVYSIKEVKNFQKKKEEEKVEQEACKNGSNGIQNDACIETNTTKTEILAKISINQASKEELMQLSGIGEAKANKIIEYREAHGGFKELEEIKDVEGIGDSLFDQIKENITL